MQNDEFYTDLDKTFSQIESLLKQYSKQTNSYLHTPSLITTRLDKRPTARTVVLRDFDAKQRYLYFFTDKRSNKVEEIQYSSLGQLHFYSHEHALQLRIDCELALLKEESKRKQYWENTDIHSKLVYLQENNCGMKIKSPESLELESKEIESGFKNFVVIQAVIQSIDCLYLHPEKHYRSYFEWQDEELQSSWLAS